MIRKATTHIPPGPRNQADVHPRARSHTPWARASVLGFRVDLAMTHATRRAAFACLIVLSAVACGGSAFTAGTGSADGGLADATADVTSSEAGVDTGATTDTGASPDSGTSPPPDGGTHEGGGDGAIPCGSGLQCTSGYCKAGVCTACTANAQCAVDQFCNTITGNCTPTKAIGAACLGPAECKSDFCADGVCCSTACNSTCEACNTPSAMGTCSPVPEGKNNPLRSCASGEVCCSSGPSTTESCVALTTVQNCGSCGNSCAMGTACEMSACSNGTCVLEPAQAGTTCGDGGICSGTGTCLP